MFICFKLADCSFKFHHQIQITREDNIRSSLWENVIVLYNGPSLCLLLWWWWSAKLNVSAPFPTSPSQHSEAYLPHFQKLFQQKGEGLPFSTLQNFTFRAAQWQKGRGLQLQKVVLCRSKSCTNCSVPAAPLSIQ